MESTIFNFNDGGFPLNNFQDVTVTEILISSAAGAITPPNWVVHGKAVLGNHDGDPQNASAWLVLMVGDTPKIIDRADVRIDQFGNTVSICLQAVVLLSPADIKKGEIEVELHCSTFAGNVVWAKLVAMTTDSATKTVGTP